MMSLIIVIDIIIILGLILFLYTLYEPHTLNVTDDDIGDIKNNHETDLNILLFSDLHVEFCFIDPSRIEKIIHEANSKHHLDAVIFAGDICNKYRNAAKGISYLKRISDYCRSEGVLFAGVTGNHDIEFTEEQIKDCGFINLDKEDITLTANNGNTKYTLYGVRDTGRENQVWTNVRRIDNNNDYSILVVHNPDQLIHLEEGIHPDYMLSGHIHGGQIRTPFNIEFDHLRPDELPKQGIHSGKHVVNGTDLFISKGIGCIALPMRLCARPEVNIIHIHSK